ncbi:hypothetical protein HMH01_05955 [Halovulum dunhuangense]|uniref:HTH luxR-type domain-containing protein n=1 Tax=Halovulum dunhuangense TaxID=1505036 RepID=A0A849L142_9RHOB|nr:LuxR C-terminal-related transcriptional regulator [Halovulum dunhuangense]NNU79980.1 hypothetical protein [Halovulum dunhuangense]
MQTGADAERRRTFVIAALVLFLCGAAFLIDALSELGEGIHAMTELVTVALLWGGAAITVAGYFRTLRRNAAVERQLDAVRGAFQAVLDRHFDEWSLTPSERDVALLSIKGLSIPQIAALRNTREGTIKAQNAAVYRKAGVSGRAELLSLFIEEIASGLSPGDSRA